MNCLLAEYERKETCKQDQRTLYVVKVADHKTTRSRKLASTAAATKLDPKGSLMTARHLSHSTETEVLHYHAFASASHSAKAVELIHQATVKDSSDTSEDEVEKEATNSLDTTRKRRREDSPMVIHKKKRVSYTKEETELIAKYFSEEIKTGSTAHKHNCKVFLSLHPTVKRDCKQIQDKVKNIVKYSS